MEIRGERVWLRPLTRTDVDRMEKWGKFAEPELQWANFDPRSESEKDIWFASGRDNHIRRRFAVVTHDNRVIGTLGLRNISRALGEGTLGIRMSASEVGKGYGTDAITALLRIALGEMSLHQIKLDVAEGNRRARRCYEKVGFRQVGQHIGLDGYTYVDMEITRREFFARHGRPAVNEAGGSGKPSGGQGRRSVQSGPR